MKRSQTNLLIASAALVTSVVAVLVSWQENRLSRASHRASVMPLIDVELFGDPNADPIELTVRVRNVGTGLAIVHGSALLSEGRPITDYAGLGQALLTPDLAATADLSWETVKGYVQPGEGVEMMTLRWPGTAENRSAFADFVRTDLPGATDRLALSVCYCSVYGSCWQGGHPWRAEPKKVRRCRATEDAMAPIALSRSGAPAQP